jgi:tRNA pseudouridine55 synthase
VTSELETSEPSGILLVNKPRGKTAFSLIAALRKRINVRKIGHAGTLDPFATGVMVLLVGKKYTTLSDKFLCQDKEYLAEIQLGISTDSYDCDGQVLQTSDIIPSLEELIAELRHFQGTIEQIPPMFSAKKVNGKKLYEYARKGKDIPRQAVKVHVETELLQYSYPRIILRVSCSKGTYIRSLAHDLGQKLRCGAHLTELKRLRSGNFRLEDCIDGKRLESIEFDRSSFFKCVYANA